MRGDGSRASQVLPTRAEAEAVVEGARVTAESIGRTVSGALDAYEEHQTAKGNRPQSVRLTRHRLSTFFTDPGLMLDDLTRPRCASYYDALRKRLATDTHRNTLAEARSFLRWCVARRWLRRNPLDGVEGQGARSHGKPQLHIDEARLWTARALELAPSQPGAVAALMTLFMDLRASEIVGLRVRDIDDGGALVWIERGKTRRARRTLEVPVELRPHLLRLTAERSADEWVYRADRGETGHPWRDWPREWVQRICLDVGVRAVTAHGMRGLHATLAVARGVTPREVADAMGHESPTTTLRSYATPEALATARQRAALTVLAGGKGARNDVQADRSAGKQGSGGGSEGGDSTAV